MPCDSAYSCKLAIERFIPSCFKGSISNYVTVPAFYPILPGVSSHYGMLIHPRFSVPFHPRITLGAIFNSGLTLSIVSNTLGSIIFIQLLRVTVAVSR